MYQRKPGDGSLFKNGYKQKETHPDWKGDFLGLDGQEYEIAGWQKATRNGDTWYSLKIQPKRTRGDDKRPERGASTGFAQSAPGTVNTGAANSFDDSDLPF